MGILANSVSVTHSSSTADDSNSGYLTDEQVTLTTSPTGSVYVWSLSKPSSSTARAALSATSGASVTITPDVAGDYSLKVDVDGTVYILRITVFAVTVSRTIGAIVFQPLNDAQVPNPATGLVVYNSVESGNVMVQKNSSGTKSVINVT